MCDIKYWDNFYSTNKLLNSPSDFCKFTLNYFKNKTNLKILDAGCGNGRDSFYLSKIHNVIGCDLSLKSLQDTELCKFVKDNFCSIDKSTFDLIYSRFTFHSITNEDHEIFLKSIKNPGTYLCIEARSDKDINCKRVHGDTHYRNLINIDYLKQILKDNNFDILFIKESDNCSIYKGENPICLRVICKKI